MAAMRAVDWRRLLRQFVLLVSVVVILTGLVFASGFTIRVGTFPFWLGIALALLLSIDFVRAARRHRFWGALCLLPFWVLFGLITLGVGEGGPQPRTHCVSNIKQLALAMLMYQDDNDDRLRPASGGPTKNTRRFGAENEGPFPPAATWYTATRKYTGGTPNDAPPVEGSPFRCPEAISPWSYAMNDRVSGSREGSADVALLFEGNAALPNASGGPEWVAYRHKEATMTVIGFADGHSKAFSRETIAVVRWDPKP